MACSHVGFHVQTERGGWVAVGQGYGRQDVGGGQCAGVSCSPVLWLPGGVGRWSNGSSSPSGLVLKAISGESPRGSAVNTERWPGEAGEGSRAWGRSWLRGRMLGLQGSRTAPVLPEFVGGGRGI